MSNYSNQILINASQPEEIRVAQTEQINDTHILKDLDIEYVGQEQKKANIYKGKISRIEPSLEAAFVDYGSLRHGFLPFKEITPDFFKKNDASNTKRNIELGQELMIQIEKEERGNKGAALTTYITLPGSYLVLMPNSPNATGISRRIEAEERREMYKLLNQIKFPDNMGVIVRTAGVGRGVSELQTDLELLLKQWEAISQACQQRSAPFLIFQEGDVVLRSIRDSLQKNIDEILIDDPSIFEKAQSYVQQLRPDFLPHLKLYQDKMPLFLRFGIEEAAELAFQRQIYLPSGGSIVIDRTEALVTIDVNSGRSTKNEDIEETALKTNLEACWEIARQLQIRDLGGLIVIDFIDMSSEDNRRQVVTCLREATKHDRSRKRIPQDILPEFGLLPMSRQRLRHTLGKANETPCPRCQGQGTIRTTQSLALKVIRAIEKAALSYANIKVNIPLDIFTYLINEKRMAIVQIEQRFQVNILLIPDPYAENSSYQIAPLDLETTGKKINSFRLINKKTNQNQEVSWTAGPPEEPAVQGVRAITPPSNQPRRFVKLLTWLKGLRSRLTKPKKISIIPAATTPDTSVRNLPARKPQRTRRTTDTYLKKGRPTSFPHRSKIGNLESSPRTNPERMNLKQAIKKTDIPNVTGVTTPESTPKESTILSIRLPLKETPDLSKKESLEIPQKELTEQSTSKEEENSTVLGVGRTVKHPRNVRRFGGKTRLRKRGYSNLTEGNKKSNEQEEADV